MSAYFLDSSTVAKVYMREQGSQWVTSLLDPTENYDLFVVRIMAAEVAAALFRRVRSAQLARADALRGLSSLRRDMERVFRIVEIQPIVIDTALEMAERHGLRGYDCVQLAGAVLTQRARTTAQMDPLILVSADEELNQAARKEGIAVEDPNLHP